MKKILVSSYTILTTEQLYELLKLNTNEHFKFFTAIWEEDELSVGYRVNIDNLSATSDFIKDLLNKSSYKTVKDLKTTDEIMRFLCDEYDYTLNKGVYIHLSYHQEKKVNDILYLDKESLYFLISLSLSTIYNINKTILTIKQFNNKIFVLFDDNNNNNIL